MSSYIKGEIDGHKADEIYVNSNPVIGGITIDDVTVSYKEFLPTLLHYICGGGYGHSPTIYGDKHKEAMTAIREFILEIKTLEEQAGKTEQDNIVFRPKIRKD